IAVRLRAVWLPRGGVLMGHRATIATAPRSAQLLAPHVTPPLARLTNSSAVRTHSRPRTSVKPAARARQVAGLAGRSQFGLRPGLRAKGERPPACRWPPTQRLAAPGGAGG